MADFIAVIRRAVDGLSNNTPEMRAKVYDKARSAVMRQLENMSPRPPEEMLRRQLDKLEAAINEVEAEHAEALPEAEELPEEAPAALAEASWEDHVPGGAPEREQIDAAADEAAEDRASVDEAEPAYAPEAAKEPEAEVSARSEYDVEPHAVSASGQVAREVEWAEEPVAASLHEPPRAAPVVEYEEVEDPWQDAEPETPSYPPVAAAREPEAVEPALPEAEPAPVEAPKAVPPFPAWDEEPRLRQEEEPVHPAREAAPLTEEAEEWLSPARSDFTAKPAPVSEPVAYEPWDFPEDTTSHPAPVEDVVPAVQRQEPAPAAPEQRRDHDFGSFAPAGRAEPVSTEVPDLLEWNVDEYRSPAAPASNAAAGAPKQADAFSDWFADVGDLKSKEPLPAPGNGNGGRPGAPLAANAVASASSDEEVDAFLESAQQSAYRKETKPRRNFAPIVLGGLGILLLAGGGFAAWTYRASMAEFVSGLTGSEPPFIAEKPASDQAEQPTTETPATDDAAAPEAKPPEEGAVQGRKFTQRLLANGSEVDEGAGTAAATGAGTEGRSVSEQNVASTVEPTDQPPVGTNAGAPAAPATTTPPAAGATAATAAGEKAFLYEEKLGQTSPIAVTGTVAWTAVRETGEDGKPNPEIQGKIAIPERGMTVLMTIKRNTDNSLPASHIIEVVFSIPPDFEGGAVDNLQRIAMKRTEQDRGDPLVAVSAQVTEDTYLVALNDFEDVIKRNLDLLSTRGWIDMPITYRNGRRALLTLDKGAAGAAVFDAVLKEWAALGSAGN